MATILVNSTWAALFAAGLAILLTAPARQIVPTFVCGFVGRFVRDILITSGMPYDWATMSAAAVIVLIAAGVAHRSRISPVVLICGILPLGAAISMFNVILELMKVSSSQGEGLAAATVALSSNTGKAFTGTLAIALGLVAGVGIVRIFRPELVDT